MQQSRLTCRSDIIQRQQTKNKTEKRELLTDGTRNKKTANEKSQPNRISSPEECASLIVNILVCLFCAAAAAIRTFIYACLHRFVFPFLLIILSSVSFFFFFGFSPFRFYFAHLCGCGCTG